MLKQRKEQIFRSSSEKMSSAVNTRISRPFSIDFLFRLGVSGAGVFDVVGEVPS